jgi:CRP-like cAMP-binding protein
MVPWTLCFTRLEAYSNANDGSSCIWEGNGNMFRHDELGFAELIFLFDIVIDTTFFIDIIITFHTALWVISLNGTPHWVLVDDLHTIRWIYLKGAFVLDLLGIFPWHFLDCIHFTKDSPDGVKFLRLLRLLKLLRLYRIRRLIEVLKQHFPRSIYMVTYSELFLILFLISHWIACIWFRLGDADLEGWVAVEGLSGPEADKFEADNGANAFHFRQWITSLYWAVTTLTTIGYGDIVPFTSEERLFGVLSMVMGSAFFAWCTGRMTAVLTNRSGCIEKFELVLDELNQFMEARDFPVQLKNRLRSYYMLKFPTKMIFNEESILASLEEGLRKECYLHLYCDIVSNVILFARCDEHTRKEICYRLHSCYCAAGSQLFGQGTNADALYLVRFGVVELFHKDKYLKSCSTGDLVGENGVLGVTADGRRAIHATAKTMTELCSLSVEDFQHLLTECPSFFATVSRSVELHVERLQQAADNLQHLSLCDWLCIDWKIVGDLLRKEQEQDEQVTIAKACCFVIREDLILRPFAAEGRLPDGAQTAYRARQNKNAGTSPSLPSRADPARMHLVERYSRDGHIEIRDVQ